MPDLTFKFEELPLLTEQGFHAGLLYGEAVISYSNNGWAVTDISLDAYKVGEKPRLVKVPRESRIYPIIAVQFMEPEFEKAIEGAIYRDREERGIAAPRSDREEHTTYRGQP